MIIAAEGLAHARGFAQIGLGVAADNVRGARLYRRLGYEPTGIRDTTQYTWTDAGGLVHDAAEEDELLV